MKLMQFAVDDGPHNSDGLLLHGRDGVAAQLKVAEERFDGDGIRRLYESVKYPLARHVVSRWRMGQVE
jgi:hypothetical protein